MFLDFGYVWLHIKTHKQSKRSIITNQNKTKQKNKHKTLHYLQCLLSYAMLICVFLHMMFLMESVGIWPDHHSDLLQGIRPTAELSPVNSILVTAAVMPTAVPYAIQVRVGAGVVPPTTLLIVGTISCLRGNEVWVSEHCYFVFWYRITHRYTLILFRMLQWWRHFVCKKEFRIILVPFTKSQLAFGLLK